MQGPQSAGFEVLGRPVASLGFGFGSEPRVASLVNGAAQAKAQTRKHAERRQPGNGDGDSNGNGNGCALQQRSVIKL